MAMFSPREAEKILSDGGASQGAVEQDGARLHSMWLGTRFRTAAVACMCVATFVLLIGHGWPANLHPGTATNLHPASAWAATSLAAKPPQQQSPSGTEAGAKAKRAGSFLVLGDWGWDPNTHGSIVSVACQQAIADKMLATMRSLGDVKFVINVGDSFYPVGVSSKSDPQWDTKWRQIYAKELRSVPWYSVYGNHDYLIDPCACGHTPEQCAQVNANASNLDFFYMPSYNWFKEHPELGLEVIGLDFNHFMWAWNKLSPPELQCPTQCFYTKCQANCEGNLLYRAKEGLGLLRKRTMESRAKNLLVFSHYPTDYFWKLPEMLSHLRNGSHHVEYFAGHRHNVDQTSTISTAPNNNWLVGGGGGWGCDTPKGGPDAQGFVVGEISEDFRIKTYPVLVDSKICCAPPPPPGPPGPKPTCVLPPWP